jgi:alpha,alpha-trehalase
VIKLDPSHDDKVLRGSVLAIAQDLTEDGFVLRYKTGETDDGMSGKEGSFLICSFWLVSALAIIGEQQRARDLMDRLLSVASPLGLPRRSSTRAPAATSATSRRPSRTWL